MKIVGKISAALNFPSKIIAVEYVFAADREEVYACQLKSGAGEVSLLKTQKGTSAEAVFSELDTRVPVIIMFSGKKVLSRKIDYSTEISDEELAARAFPGVQRESLIFQIHRLEGPEYSVSAIRKDTVEEILEAFQKLKIEVLDIGVSPYSLWPLLKVSSQSDPKVGKYHVDIEALDIRSLEGVDGQAELFGQFLPAEFTGAFIYGIQAMANRAYQSDYPPLVNGRNEWKYGILFKKGMLVTVSLFFALLLINFLLFTHYQSENAELGQLTQAYDLQFKEVSELRNSFEEKNQFLRINGGQNSMIGQMGDQLTALLPKQLSLTEMNFQPVTEKLKKESLIRFARNELQIKGSTENYEAFRKWLNQLRGLAWVGDIEIIGYQETDSKHRADFSIKVKLRNEY